jgi:hypothetical protein
LSTGTPRPLRLQVVGEKPGEGKPADPGQARMQASIHEQGGGASVGPQGARPSLPALKDSTCSHSLLEGSKEHREGRREQGGANSLCPGSSENLGNS